MADMHLHRADQKSVLIFQMPLATPEFPGLGPTIIHSILNKDGISCDINYANLRFSRLISGDAFVEKQLAKLGVSEIIFTPYAFSQDPDFVTDYLNDYLNKVSSGPLDGRRERLRALVDTAGVLLDELMDEVDWTAYGVVGFSCMMQQTVASLALAQRIKARYPEISIVFGGPSIFEPMGSELLRLSPNIDAVVDGEADAIVTPLMRHLLQHGPNAINIAGVSYRDSNGALHKNNSQGPFDALDSLPIPDYSSFFTQLENAGLSHVQPYLTIETSRGCWWGQKNHCSFCGIGDDAMRFRSKSEPRVVQEILTLSAQYTNTDFFVVDSIINISFIKTLLPKIGELREKMGFDFSFFYESKSNLKRDQIRMMRYAGINAVQPGIESLDSDILSLMRKGSTAARQVQCLKFLAECEIIANWNLIFKIPHEKSASYHNTLAAIPALHHIPPLHGEGMIPMLLNRYAPYHNTPELYDISNIEPLPWFQHVFPIPDIDVQKMAFYFKYDCPTFDDQQLIDSHRQVYKAIQTWQNSWQERTLIQRRGPGFVQIDDTRRLPDGAGGLLPARSVRTTLSGINADIFSACDSVTTPEVLKRIFAEHASPEQIDDLLARLIADLLIFASADGELVSLPLLLETRAVSDLPQVLATPHQQAKYSSLGKALFRQQPIPEQAQQFSPAPAGIASAQDWLDRLFDHARQTHQLHYDLGRISTADPLTRQALNDLANARKTALFGFAFQVSSQASALGPDDARLLADAGVCAVTLCDDTTTDSSAGDSLAHTLQSVRALSEQQISVRWSLGRADDQSRPSVTALAKLAATLKHLPPPSAFGGLSLDALPEPERSALADWRENHRPHTLSYARGPGFLRFLDSRNAERNWRFVVLNDQQAHVYSTLFHATPRADLKERLGLPSQAVDQLLDGLEQAGLIYQGDGYAVALAPRRHFNESWASGDH